MPLDASLPFDPGNPSASLADVPEAPGVFALYAGQPERADLPPAEPYLAQTTNLRRRLMRMLSARPAAGAIGNPAPPVRSRRLQLAHLVRRVDFTVTGSEFESILVLYRVSAESFGVRARRRLRLRAPVFLRMSVENPYPRVWVTTKVAKSASRALFGPFPSRPAAERYVEAVLNLFELRRCTEDLHPDPSFPGCLYSEMKMCLAPCYLGCTDARYQEEAAAVLKFLSTRGESLLQKLAGERDAASEALDFERAAELHLRIQKAAAAASLASEAVRPLAQLSAILVQKGAGSLEAALFELRSGILHGPVHYSMAGVMLANEQSGSSSLFPQPFVVEPIPLSPPAEGQAGIQDQAQHPSDFPVRGAGVESTRTAAVRAPKGLLESRLDEAFERLAASRPRAASAQMLSDHLSLFTRWYYRPASRRVGEVVFAGEDGQPPRKALLRAISRVLAPRVEPASSGPGSGC